MSDSDIFSLNSSAFIKITSRIIVAGPVPQCICNFHTCWGEKIISRPAPISFNHPRLPENFGNASRQLAPIFLANTFQRIIENVPTLICASQESIYRPMEI